MSNIFDEAIKISTEALYYVDRLNCNTVKQELTLQGYDTNKIEKALELGKSYNQLLSKIQQVFEREVDGYILSLAEIDKRYNEIYSLLKELLENE